MIKVKRIKLDFEVDFTNGGGIQAQVMRAELFPYRVALMRK